MAANQNVLQLSQQTTSAALSSVFYAVTGGTTDTGLPLSVFVNNLGLTGIPTVPTAAPGTNTTQIASCAFVVTSYAPLASPALTGTPTVPTASTATNTTQIASTAYVQNNLVNYAVIASPTFTGVPAAPTAGTGTSTTQIATTAFVANTFATPPALGASTPNSGAFTTISATGAITPNASAGIVGTTAVGNANAGSVGEFISSVIIAGSAVALSNNVTANITSISLTAGDWDVTGLVATNPAGTTTTTLIQGGISLTSATNPGIANGAFTLPISAGAGVQMANACPVVRVNVSTTTTVFLVMLAQFAVSTCGGFGYIRARRVR